MKKIFLVLTLILSVANLAMAEVKQNPLSLGDVYELSPKHEISAEEKKGLEDLKSMPITHWVNLVDAERISHGRLGKVPATQENLENLAQYAVAVGATVWILENLFVTPRNKVTEEMVGSPVLLNPTKLHEIMVHYHARLARRVEELVYRLSPPRYSPNPALDVARSMMFNNINNYRPMPAIRPACLPMGTSMHCLPRMTPR